MGRWQFEIHFCILLLHINKDVLTNMITFQCEGVNELCGQMKFSFSAFRQGYSRQLRLYVHYLFPPRSLSFYLDSVSEICVFFF